MHYLRLSKLANIALAILLLLLIFPNSGNVFAASSEEQFIEKDVSLPPLGIPKLDSQLSQLVDAQAKGQLIAFSKSAGMELKDDRVRIIIESVPGKKDAVISLITSLGGTVETSYQDLIQTLVPIGQFKALAANNDVKLVSRAKRPIEFAMSEGIGLINASDWHASGFTGAGVKIGILDGGFSGYSSLLGSDLPATANVFTHWAPSLGGPGSSNHGTACAEIVYDMAPGAQLYLANFGTSVEAGDAVNWLISQGVNVISCSMGDSTAGPGDGTGLYCDAVTTAKNSGILWSQAAGNSALTHWSGTFSDTNGDTFHEFLPNANLNCFNAEAGTKISIETKWDDSWGYSINNYDLYLYQLTSSGWVGPIMRGNYPQSGGSGDCNAPH